MNFDDDNDDDVRARKNLGIISGCPLGIVFRSNFDLILLVLFAVLKTF